MDYNAPEAYTFEELVVEAFRAENRCTVEEVCLTYATPFQQNVAGCLTFAEKEEMTGVSGPRLKLVEEKAIADLLVGVESAFGLNVTELSKCLKVSRQGIYDWRRQLTRMPAIRQENRERVERLTALADKWWEKVGLPLPRHLRRTPVNGRETLCEILSHDDIIGEEVDRALEVLIELALLEKSKMQSSSSNGAKGTDLADLLDSSRT